MSRSNPKKRKPRVAKQTVLAAGEGQTEEAFLKFLRELFGDRNDDIKIDVCVAPPGSPKSMVVQVCKRSPENYDRAFLLLDTDVLWLRGLAESAEENNDLVLIGSDRCVEGLFLSILNPGKDYSTWQSKTCKREFHKLLSKDEKLIARNYSKVFTKKKLLEARKRIPALDQLLTLMFPGKELR